MPHPESQVADKSSRQANARVIAVAVAVENAELHDRVLTGLDGEKFLVRAARIGALEGPAAEVVVIDQTLACAELAGFHDRIITGDVGVLLIGRNLTADVLLPHDFTRRELRLATRMLAQVVSLRRQNRRLQQLALSDALTQLPNRRAIEERFGELVGGEIRVALGLFDIDHFKTVNSKLGYNQGDDVLRSVGKLLAARSAPHFAGRLGGDEFAVLLSAVDHQAVFTLTESLRHDVALAASMKAARPISASAGVAVISGGATFADALASADAALRRAKQAGGKRTEMA